MKKLISILLTFALLSISALALVGCPAEEEVQNELSVNEPTPKELFMEGLSNAFGSSDSEAEQSDIFTSLLFNSGKDYVSQSKIDILKYKTGEFDLTEYGTLSITASNSVDFESQLLEMSTVINFLGEEAPIKYLYSKDGTYFVDMFGINEKPLFLENYDFGEEGTNPLDSIIDKYGDISKLSEALGAHFAEATEKVLSAHSEDGVYTSETKTVTLEGKEYKDASVITFTISGGKVAQIANELVDELLAHEDIDAILGEDFDKNVYLDGFDGLKEIRIRNTVSEKKTVGLDIEFESTEDPDEEDNGPELTPLSAKPLNGTAESESDASKAEDDNLITVIETINCVFDGENYYISFGTMKNGAYDLIEGYYTVKSVRNAETNEYEFIIKENTNTATTELLSFKGTKTDKKTEGVFTFVDEPSINTMKVSFEGDEKSGKIMLSEFKTSSSNSDVTYDFDANIQLVYTIEESKVNLGGKLYITVNEKEIEMEANVDEVIEFKDVTLEKITDYMAYEDFDITQANEKLSEKYPKISGFFNSMAGGESEELFPYYIEGEEDELTLLLPEGFVEQEQDYFSAYYENEERKVLVFVSEYPFEGSNVESLEEFMVILVEENSDKLVSPVTFADGVPYVVIEQDGTHILASALMGESSFWLIQFNCPEDYFSDYQALFIAWAVATDNMLHPIDTDFDF